MVLEKKSLKSFVNDILLFCIYPPLKEGTAFHFNRLESLTQSGFFLSLFEIDLVVLWKNICKFRQFIFVISLLSPLRKGRGYLFEQTWVSLTHECFVPCLLETSPVVLEMRSICEKFTDRQIDTQTTDDSRSWNFRSEDLNKRLVNFESKPS